MTSFGPSFLLTENICSRRSTNDTKLIAKKILAALKVFSSGRNRSTMPITNNRIVIASTMFHVFVKYVSNLDANVT